jgi:transcriptional regulator with GAF, ATPase, and Fis domain
MHQEPQRKFYLKEFKAISCAISTYEDLNLLFDHFVEGVARAFNVKGASIMLYDEALDQLFHVSSHGISSNYLNKGPVFLRDQEDAFKKGEPVFIQNLENDSRVQYMEAARSENIRAMLSFPIRCRTFVVGVLRIYSSQGNCLAPGRCGFHSRAAVAPGPCDRGKRVTQLFANCEQRHSQSATAHAPG